MLLELAPILQLNMDADMELEHVKADNTLKSGINIMNYKLTGGYANENIY